MESIKIVSLKNLFSVAVWSLLLSGIVSCSDWDDYKKYTEEGEIVYPGKITSLQILPGENRVRIIGTLGADPRVSEVRIFWNDFKDSLILEATAERKANGFDETLSIQEGLRTFVIRTYDDMGNVSLPVSEIGVSYGDRYRAKIANKVVSSIVAKTTSTVLVWKPFDLSTGAKYTSIKYLSGTDTLSLDVPAGQDSTVLTGLVLASKIKYQTIFLPNDDCIDLFYSNETEYSVVR
jgi:hypothetical protein